MRNLLTIVVVSALVVVATAWKCCSSVRTSRGLSMLSDGRRALMGGNWKLNPTSLDGGRKLAHEVSQLTKGNSAVDVVIFPPFPLIPDAFKEVSSVNGNRVKIGAQDVFYETSGAFTGAVSVQLLKEVGVSHVLVGHSERRTIFREEDGVINRKVKKVLKDGLRPVLCIGESKEEYEAGLNQHICALQLLRDLHDVSPEDMLKVAIAYEPVWAIGTGLVCPKEVAQNVHAFIRSTIAHKYGDAIARQTVIQYGGSVNVQNVKELMAQPDIDGCLVGGASLSPENFSKIVNYSNL